VTIARALGISLIAGALVAGTLLDRIPRDAPKRVNGQLIVAADFHVHAFVGDGGVPPWELPREARRRGLDAIVISNHNQRLAARLASLAARIYPGSEAALVIRGQELTAPGFHMVAAGISRTIDWRLPAAAAIAEIHNQGGIAIAAHPGRTSWPAYDTRAVAALDGAEVAHPAGNRFPVARRELLEFFERSTAVKPSLAPIGSSDFHFGGTLGECRTYLFVDEFSESGVLEAVRRGATVASDGRGQLTGDPARVAAVRQLLSENPPPPRAPWPPRLAAYASVLGVLILLLWK